MKRLILALTILPLITICGYAQYNRFEVEASYTRTDLPIYNDKAEVENVNGFTVGGNFKLFNFGKKASVLAGYKFNRKLDQEVFPRYFDGTNIVDLYRNVDTHSVGGEIDVLIFFAGLSYGVRRIHEDAPHQLIRNIRLGLKVPVGSKFFFKSCVNYEQPFGTLPAGFVNPYNRSFEFGGGFTFK